MELYNALMAYAQNGAYPFHMPGHKRQMKGQDPYAYDITEITGFDDLHHAEGILLRAETEAAEVFGAGKTYYSVNGSTAANLAGFFACVPEEGEVLMARNCHKSVYHAALLRNARVHYLFPPVLAGGIYGSMRPEDIEAALLQHPGICAVILTSPTYEGVLSDAKAIADIVHAHGAMLMVDEAHGAHLGLAQAREFGTSAVRLGADCVSQSLHKMLPSLTQTALLHVQSPKLMKKTAFYMRVFQSSSPSYVLMGSMDRCISEMRETPQEEFHAWKAKLDETRQILHGWEPGDTVYGKDPSKLVIFTPEGMSGSRMCHILYEEAQLEMEMAAEDYVLAMTGITDPPEAYSRLQTAVLGIYEKYGQPGRRKTSAQTVALLGDTAQRMLMGQAKEAPSEVVDFAKAFIRRGSPSWCPVRRSRPGSCKDYGKYRRGSLSFTDRKVCKTKRLPWCDREETGWADYLC